MTHEHQNMYGRALAREVSTMPNDAKKLKFGEDHQVVGTDGASELYRALDMVGKQGAVDLTRRTVDLFPEGFKNLAR